MSTNACPSSAASDKRSSSGSSCSLSEWPLRVAVAPGCGRTTDNRRSSGHESVSVAVHAGGGGNGETGGDCTWRLRSESSSASNGSNINGHTESCPTDSPLVIASATAGVSASLSGTSVM
ncbi:unnamed protein product, partial [Sphacelaria rigidula]